MTTLAERLKIARGKATQKEFSRSLKVSQSSYSLYEQGQRIPDADILYRICDLYKVDAHWLLMGIGKPHEEPTACGMSQISEPESAQPPDFTNTTKNTACDMSQVLGGDLMARCLHLADENAALLRQNGDLRVEVERQRARIADLERQLEAAQPAGMARLEQENRRLRERVRELEQELDRIILHMPPPTDKAQQLLPSLRGEGKP